MQTSVTINNTLLNVKEYQGHRVVTFADVDTVHGRPAGTARRNFNTNRKHFIDGEDFFLAKPADFRMNEIRTSEINNRGTIVLTETGYLMLVKSFTDDLAWKVQRELVRSYFRTQTAPPALPAKEYVCTEKRYKRKVVMTIKDAAHFTGLHPCTIRRAFRYLSEKDYIRLEGEPLKAFLAENPSVDKHTKVLYLMTKSAFEIICILYGIDLQKPKALEIPMYHPHDAMRSLIAHIENAIGRVHQNCEQLLTDSTMNDAVQMRKQLVSSLQELKWWWFDAETIRLEPLTEMIRLETLR